MVFLSCSSAKGRLGVTRGNEEGGAGAMVDGALRGRAALGVGGEVCWPGRLVGRDANEVSPSVDVDDAFDTFCLLSSGEGCFSFFSWSRSCCLSGPVVV